MGRADQDAPVPDPRFAEDDSLTFLHAVTANPLTIHIMTTLKREPMRRPEKLDALKRQTSGATDDQKIDQ